MPQGTAGSPDQQQKCGACCHQTTQQQKAGVLSLTNHVSHHPHPLLLSLCDWPHNSSNSCRCPKVTCPIPPPSRPLPPILPLYQSPFTQNITVSILLLQLQPAVVASEGCDNCCCRQTTDYAAGTRRLPDQQKLFPLLVSCLETLQQVPDCPAHAATGGRGLLLQLLLLLLMQQQLLYLARRAPLFGARTKAQLMLITCPSSSVLSSSSLAFEASSSVAYSIRA